MSNTTFLEALGFKDPDLTSSKHDEIIIWLTERVGSYSLQLADKEFKEIQKRLNGHHKDLATDYLRRHHSPGESVYYVDKFIEEHSDLFSAVPLPELTFDGYRLEYPIIKKGYKDVESIVGFADLVSWVSISVPIIWRNIETGKIEWAFHDFKHYQYIFEVKSKITSLGELLRQISTYKTYEKTSQFIVVAPPTAFAKTIVDQHILFLEYTN